MCAPLTEYVLNTKYAQDCKAFIICTLTPSYAFKELQLRTGISEIIYQNF